MHDCFMPQFAIDMQRSLYDCLYLALAAAIDGVLVTADRKFYAAVAKGVYGRRVLWVEDRPLHSIAFRNVFRLCIQFWLTPLS